MRQARTQRILSVVLGVCLALAVAIPALAAKPALNCAAGPSGHEMVTKDGWWENTVEGFDTEGIDVYVGDDPNNGFTQAFEDIAAAFDFVSAQAFKDFILGPQWDQINKNGDAYVCMKPYPHTPGNPAYLFSGTDNNAT